MADQTAAPRTKRLADYRPPAFLIDTVDLAFDLRADGATVRSKLRIRRNPAPDAEGGPLVLDGQALELRGLSLDGETLGANRYQLDDDSLTIPDVPDVFTLEVETAIKPHENTTLEGLYVSGGNFATQCEAEGFRRITYFLDRPDVLARYTTTIVADAATCPVLLSNGNPVASGRAGDGRHWAKWEDPFPKPSYLFALVAGALEMIEDSFVTRSGRTITLRIFVRPADLAKCGHAVRSLKAAMAWDEKVYGFEYDLDLFMIVAVSDFNMGAMENKGLNIFNTALVLASPETATDADFQRVESVVAHEYFHNWTGNRITCRDWFQLSLKEGLTVFRDQAFSADMNGAAVGRIADVRRLRAIQFPEDAGPTAHPIRPESYIEINNFYTPTVYEKGAEVVRMMHTLLGPEGYRQGIDLYVERHDGSAATCEDFVAAMEDAGSIDLGRFRRWYSQAGTPRVEASDSFDEASGRWTLTLRQSTPPTPGQGEKLPLHIPVALGLVGPDGGERAIRLEGETQATSGTRVLSLFEAEESFVFEGLDVRPVPSLFRDFSAPVRLEPQSRADLEVLFAYDPNPFNRWEAGQQIATRLLLDGVADGGRITLPDAFVAAIDRLLADEDLDPAFVADAILLPSEAFLADQMAVIDVEAIHAVREAARAQIGHALADRLRRRFEAMADTGAPRIDAAAMGRRALKNVCLAYLSTDPGSLDLVVGQAERGTTMTDVLGALSILRDLDTPDRPRLLAAFYERWQDEALVVDKWFTLQATSSRADTVATVEALLHHPAFTWRTPNRVRSVVSAFASANPLRFHQADGAGYAFLADQIIHLNGLNPQLAARTLIPLGRWQRHEPKRRGMMQAQLDRILAEPGLSPDVYEIASKSRA